jgi:general secretion pathway protein G
MKEAWIVVLLVAGVALAFGQPDVQAKEKQLKEALFSLRTSIDEYTYDHSKAPQSLTDLVREHYLRSIPVDPMAGSRISWRLIMEDPSNTINRDAPGIFDVRSASIKTSSGGTRYAEW